MSGYIVLRNGREGKERRHVTNLINDINVRHMLNCVAEIPFITVHGWLQLVRENYRS